MSIVARITGIPAPQVTWIFNGKTRTKNQTVHTEKTGETYIMKINEVSVRQAGTYTITAENFGGDDKKSFTLDVVGKQDIMLTYKQAKNFSLALYLDFSFRF